MKYGLRIENPGIACPLALRTAVPAMQSYCVLSSWYCMTALSGDEPFLPAFRPLRSLTTICSPSFSPETISASLAVCNPSVTVRSSSSRADSRRRRWSYRLRDSSLHRHGRNIVFLVKRKIGFGIEARQQHTLRIRPHLLRCAWCACLRCTSTENRATLPGKVRFSEGTRTSTRIANADVAHVGFRNRNHQAEQIVLR